MLKYSRLWSLFILILIVFHLFSCRKIVQDEFDSFTNLITINAVLVEGDSIKVHLTFSDELNDQPLNVIADAQVEVVINHLNIDTLSYSGNGIYSSDYICSSGDNIEIHVITAQGKPIFANTIIPDSTNINATSINDNVWIDNEGISQPALYLSIKNNPLVSEYFEVMLFADAESVSFLVNDENSENEFIEVQIPFKKGYTNSLMVEFRAVSFSYYEYVRTYKLYLEGRYPEFGIGTVLPFNIYSNIDNGLGIFCAYNPSYPIQLQISN